MTVSDSSTSVKKHKKHKKIKSSRDSTAEQTEVPAAEDITTDVKKSQKPTDSKIILEQLSGKEAVKKKKSTSAESTNPTDDEIKTVSNDKSSHREKKRKRTLETSEEQIQDKKRVKTEDSPQETDSNTKQKTKTAAEKKKRKKKRKEKDNSQKLASFLVQPQDDSSNVQTSVIEDEETEIQPDATSESDKKVPKKKKKPKIIQKQENTETVEPEKPSAKDLAKSYLKLWKKDKSNWSFKKVRQIWLIKHLYDAESVNKKYFKYLLQYLEESKGAVRSRLIENAQSVFESSSSNAEGEEAPDPVKVERARMIIQMLTE